MVEPLSPELALVDPALAERARAQLTDSREPVPRPAPVNQPPPPPPLRPPPIRTVAVSAGPLRPVPRRRISGNAIVAAVAVAAALGGRRPQSWLALTTAPRALEEGRSSRRSRNATACRRLRLARGRAKKRSTQGVAGASYTRSGAPAEEATGGSRPRAPCGPKLSGRPDQPRSACPALPRSRSTRSPPRPCATPRCLADFRPRPDRDQPASLALPTRLDRHRSEVRLVARRRGALATHPRRPPRRVPLGHRLPQ